MSSLRALRNRINSVRSTQKITHAMQLVAANKVGKLQHMTSSSEKARLLMDDIILNTIPSIALPDNLTEKLDIVVFITGDKGLCGSYNSSAIKKFKTNYSNAAQSSKVIVVGKKGGSHFASGATLYLNLIGDYEGIASMISREIVDLLFEKVCKVTICFNEYINVAKYQYAEQDIWPIIPPKQESNYAIGALSARTSLLLYFKTKLMQALLSSATAEFAARMLAMDSASKNAKELINKLTLKFNRTRQECITKELIEIISGAEAL